MAKYRREIARDDVGRPRRGDIFTVRTVDEHTQKHNAPGDINEEAFCAENPFEGPQVRLFAVKSHVHTSHNPRDLICGLHRTTDISNSACAVDG